MRSATSAEDNARRQAAVLGLSWWIVGEDRDWNELQVWLDLIAERRAPQEIERRRPPWVHLQGDREGRSVALVDVNLVTSIWDEATGLVTGVAYGVDMASRDGGDAILEHTGWGLSEGARVPPELVPLEVIELSRLLGELDRSAYLTTMIEEDPNEGNRIVELLRSPRHLRRVEGAQRAAAMLGWDALDPEPDMVLGAWLEARWLTSRGVPRIYVEPYEPSEAVRTEAQLRRWARQQRR